MHAIAAIARAAAPLGAVLALVLGGLATRADAGSGTGHAVPGLDRIAAAVSGAESSHGADPRMWRPDPAGPQGPMQIGAAAATDVGGGDRFDPADNRRLGRAYLAQLYRRFGDWPDALAAYNWGPGRVEAWVAGGRRPSRLPPEVLRYQTRVIYGFPAGGHRLRHGGIVHRQPRSRHRQRLGHGPLGRLYAAVLRASAPPAP